MRSGSCSSRTTALLTFPNGGKHEFGGVITWLLQKMPESGEWKVLLGHTSTPGGPPERNEE